MRSLQSLPTQRSVIRKGFRWDRADAYLFDIDGTLLNSRDSIHYFAFVRAVRQVLSIEVRMDGVPVHGHTDVGIVREVLRRAGITEDISEKHLPRILETMCTEVGRNYQHLRPEVCPAIPALIHHLRSRGALLGTASGNLEAIGWWKLEKAELKEMFAFGSFSWPRETRAEIFGQGLLLARQRLGAAASVCVVGDTPADIEAARMVGTDVIALATGIFPFEELLACGPDACLACAADLLSLPEAP
ncbi:MAG TPA: HAD family hydrolase [Terriglobales bacterium]